MHYYPNIDSQCKNQYIYMFTYTFICNVHLSCLFQTEDCMWKVVELCQLLLEVLSYWNKT